MPKEVTKYELDQLVEVINIGAGNASTALHQLINKKISLKVPEVIIDKVESVSNIINEAEKVVTMVLLKVLGDVPGTVFLMFSPASANALVNFVKSKYKSKEKGEIEQSILREIGNILAGSSLTALARFLNLNIAQSVPETVTDMSGSLVESIIAEMGKTSDEIMVFKVNFFVEGHKVNGRLFFIFDPISTKKILSAIRKKFSKK